MGFWLGLCRKEGNKKIPQEKGSRAKQENIREQGGERVFHENER